MATNDAMKGVMFCIVEEMTISHFGEETWDDVLRRAAVDGAYTSLGDYPDVELGAIVRAAADIFGKSVPDTLVMAGRLAFPMLAQRYPHVLADLSSWQDLLQHLDDIIHPEVGKIFRAAAPPQFATRASGMGLTLTYQSTRRLCRLAEGLALGSGDHFGVSLTIAHTSCVDQGNEICELLVTE